MQVSDLKGWAASSLPAWLAATVKPSCLRDLEMAAPMPRLPPVTNATRAMVFPPTDDEANGSGEPLTGGQPCVKGASLRLANRQFLALHAKSDAHAAADAERREALLGVALLHFVQERHQHPRAGGPDRVANGDRTAIDVHDVLVPAHVLVDRESLGGEGLVGLDEVKVGDLPAGLFERLA